MSVEEKTLTKESLDQFHGCEKAYPAPGGRIYTEGVRHVIEAGGAWWLITDIAVYGGEADVAGPCGGFQLWTLKTHDRPNGVRSATLTCVPDEGKSPLFRHEYTVTDFPLDEIDILVIGDTILLPSEY